MSNPIRDESCTKCMLYEGCKTVCNTPPINTKNPHKPLMIVMDYPAYEDDKNGTQMQSKREQTLMAILEKVIKADINDIHFTYAVKCRPADENPPEKDHADTCMYYLEEEILLVKPKVVLTLGDFTTKVVIGKSGITSHRGKIFDMEIDGFVTSVIPTYSPSFIERTDRNLKQFAEDVMRAYYKAIDFVQEGQQYAKTISVNKLKLFEEVLGYVRETGVLCFDFETTGLDTFAEDFQVTALAISFQIGSAYVVPLYHQERIFTDDEISWMMVKVGELMSDPNIRKIAQNSKFDMHCCARMGIHNFRGRFDDTMLMHHLLDETKPHGLKEMVAEHFPQFEGYDDEVKKHKWDNVPWRVLAPYAGTDSDLTLRLALFFEIELLKDAQLYKIYRNEVMPANLALFHAEYEGMYVDLEFLEKAVEDADIVIKEITEKLLSIRKVRNFMLAESEIVNQTVIDKIRLEIKELEKNEPNKRTETAINNRKEKINKIKLGTVDHYAELNLGSPKQLGRLLYEKHGFGFKMPYDRKKRKPAPLTGAEHINEFNDKSGFIENLLLLRSIEKISGTYFKGLISRADKAGKIHTSFLLHGTTSGRLSSQNPNLQNLPNVAKLTNEIARRIVAMVKKAFTCPKLHKMVQVDFSQMELRLVGDFAVDREMIRAYAANEDIHKVTGAKLAGVTLEMFKELADDIQKMHRTNAKPANFGLIYGQSAEGYMNYAKTKYGVELTLSEATKSRDAFFKLYRQLPDYHALYIEKAKKFGYVRTLFGRKRRTPNINSSDKFLRGEDERVAVNSPIQGSGGEITIFVFALLRARLDPRIKIVNTIHDSIIFYIPDDLFDYALPLIKLTAENPPTLEYFGREMQHIDLKVDFEVSDESWKDMKEYEVI